MAKDKKLKVGITGSIGSGKSLFCKYLRESKFQVIDADDTAKNILASNVTVQKKIIKTFGEQSYLNGKLNKKFLAEKVFSDPENVNKINSIVHPETIKKINNLADQVLIKEKIVFVEAALIYEANMEKLFDYVVLITANEIIRKERKIKYNNFTEEEFIKRNLNQIKDEEKRKRADFVFENDEGMKELKQKADLLLRILHSL